ncbi:protein GAMETE CELL DEFECTIVE 1, mitochondrial [Syzygium oleosum]|uniref:protein GAMETE CELL DEFECTIVE 1, mitochondrial n=1 Tax=Syzygium oleosum TaxID=219896 RepID=UPI0011D2AF74|nr:protein GAMETE CELL DEFECTIVE 1, mitochondrial [Syzygium oleosum]
MHALRRLAKPTLGSPDPARFLALRSALGYVSAARALSTKNGGGGDEWKDAWETAWLPDDLSSANRAPWESDVNFPSSGPSSPAVVLPSDADAETKAFVEDMNENWEERSKVSKSKEVRQREKQRSEGGAADSSLYSLENIKKDYRLKKQRIHAGLWVKEIEKQEEAKLGAGDDIERLLHTASEIFDSPSCDWNSTNLLGSSEFKNKPDGWETTSKSQDENVWEMSQREEDILLQEFERRIAYSKFQIASFIKSHIFSRRRPVDGWKYMIEVVGPNAQKGKGSAPRLPSLADASTQPFREEKAPIGSPVQNLLKRR